MFDWVTIVKLFLSDPKRFPADRYKYDASSPPVPVAVEELNLEEVNRALYALKFWQSRLQKDPGQNPPNLQFQVPSYDGLSRWEPSSPARTALDEECGAIERAKGPRGSSCLPDAV